VNFNNWPEGRQGRRNWAGFESGEWMDTENIPKFKKLSLKNQAHVRFNDKEFDRVAREAASIGLSVPRLLKETYFEKPPLRILMGHQDQKKWVLEILRIGNNINQIARHLNAGILGSAAEDIKDVSRKLNIIMLTVVGTSRQA
jgi:hypothetical protein